jgi:hypothetical protein
MFRAATRALVVPVLVTALGSAGLVLAPSAQALDAVSQAEGRFVDGQVGATDLSALPEASSAFASVPGVAGPVSVPVSAGGLDTVPGLAGVVTTGAANQVAGASASGASWSAAGAVTDAGDVALGGDSPASVSLDLAPYLAEVPVVGSALSGLEVSLAGVAATARQAAGADGAQTGDYAVAGGVLRLTSPLVADLPDAVADAVAPVQAAVDSLAGPTGGLASALYAIPVIADVLAALTGSPSTTATVTADLAGAVGPLLAERSSPDGLVTLDPAAGTVEVDLAALVGGAEGLNGLPLDTEVLSPSVLALVDDAVSALVGDLVAEVQETVEAAVAAAPVSLVSTQGTLSGLLATGYYVVTTGTLSQVLDGTAASTQVLKLLGVTLTLTKATLLDALAGAVTDVLDDAALPALVTDLAGVLAPVTDTLAPGLLGVPDLLSLVVNHQETDAGAFTQSAVVATLLPTAPAGRMSFANARTGQNNGPAADAAPVVDGIDPAAGPTAGGQSVTLTGSGFELGNLVTIGGTLVPDGAVQVDSPYSLTFTTPAHVAGTVDVTVTTTNGTSDPVSYRYLDPPVLTTVAPIAGPAAGGVRLSLVGDGFDPGGTSVLIGGRTVAPADVTVVSPTRLWFRTPRHGAGIVTTSVTTAGGTSDVKRYVYLPKPTLTRIKTLSGPAAGGTQVILRGSGFRAGATHVLVDSLVVPAAAVDVRSSTELRFTTPAHARGAARLRVVNPAGTSAYKTFTYTRGAAVAPRVRALSRTTFSTTGGQPLVVTGSGFVPGTTSVRFGSVKLGPALVTVQSPTRLRVLAPAVDRGRHAVTVTTRGGTSAARRVAAQAPSTRATARPTLDGPDHSPDMAPFLTGRGRPGATVTAYVDGLAWCSATVAEDRSWACAGSRPLLRGTHRVAARQVRDDRSVSPLTAWTTLTIGPA